MSLICAEIISKADFANRLDKERQLNMLEVDRQSFDWVWSSAFADWLKSDASIFWIAGKPASGKSTLVNYLAKHKRTRELAARGAGHSVKVVKFFFDFRARDGITNNFEGLRRSLLYQLLGSSATLAAEAGAHFGLTAHQDLFSLKSFDILRFVLRKNTQPLLFFIDGLDEYQGQKPELLCLVDDILSFDVRICLSSRNEKPFSVAYRDLQHKFLMDRVNQPGIEAYARGRFETTLMPKHDQEKQDIDLAAKTISEKSSGVFLWARFAVLEVIDAICDGDEIGLSLQNIVWRMPPELEQVYARIFSSIQDDDRRRSCGLMMQLVDSAQRNLRVAQLFEAMLVAGDSFRPLTRTMDDIDLVNFQRHIGALGAGLVEIVPDETLHENDLGGHTDAAFIRMIHRTVQTYLRKTGWTELLGKPLAPGSQQRLWMQTCTSFMAGNRVNWRAKSKGTVQLVPIRCSVLCTDSLVNAEQHIDNTSRSRDGSSDHGDTDSETSKPAIRWTDLQDYVNCFMMSHALMYERETQRSSRSLLQTTLNAIIVSDSEGDLITADRDLQDHAENFSYRWLFCSDVHMAAFYGLGLYVEEAIRQSAEIVDFFRGSFTEGMLLSRTPWERRSVPRRRSIQRGCGASLLATVVYSSVLSFYLTSNYAPQRSSLVELLVPLSPHLGDFDMLIAIQALSMTEIEALLTEFPWGPLKLRSSLVDHHLRRILTYGNFGRELRPRYTFGPLWAVGSREFDSIETAGVLRLFLERGEDINAQCGPSGTMLHAAVRHESCSETSSVDSLHARFRMYVANGADLNAVGPHGNILEYSWREVHTSFQPCYQFWVSCGRLIKFLVDLDLHVSICDPSGQIPSRERILAVAERDVPSAEDMSLYYYGTSTKSNEWRTGRDGKQERCFPMSRRQDDDAEDAASM